MRAWTYDQYGGPEGLKMTDMPEPTPGKGEVLVAIEAVGLNGSDHEMLTGQPLYARINGLRRPGRRVLGSDIAGTVVALGDGVTELAEGDTVFGDILECHGGLAERAAVPTRLLVRRDGLDPTDAAALPQNGAIALQGIGDADLGGKSVLINGAGGAAGTLAVQRAMTLGAQVTVVDAAAKLDRLKRFGVDRALDCRLSDYTRTGRRHDLILDLFGTRGPVAVSRALAPGGRYRSVGGPVGPLIACALLGPLLGLASSWSIGVLSLKQSPDMLRRLRTLAQSGELSPVIDSTWGFDEVPAAFARARGGQNVGKVMVRLPAS